VDRILVYQIGVVMSKKYVPPDSDYWKMKRAKNNEYYWKKTRCKPGRHVWIHAGVNTDDEPDPLSLCDCGAYQYSSMERNIEYSLSDGAIGDGL